MPTFRKRVLLISFMLLITAAALFAMGGREVPQISVENPSPWYLSPTGTSATAKHTGSATFSVQMSMKSKEGYIPEYSIAIVDSNGKTVRDIVQKQKADLGFFARLFVARKSFTLKKTFTWDGKDNNGTVVPDGRYTAKITVIAQDGTKRDTTLGTFVVDTQAPQVTISAPNGLVFNPKGKRAAITIDQTNGTVEKLWTGTFYNASGEAVRSYTWQDSAPKSFSWDGRDSSGQVAPDGHYVYRITSTDQAGNESQNVQIGDIVVNTEQTPVALALSNPYFSPNGDGIKDTSTFELSTSSKAPSTSWKVEVSNPIGTVLRSYSGTGPFPSTIQFNGKNDSGSLLPDATYTVTFDASFANGNQGEATAPLVLNTLKPPLAISYSNPAFSPNGDGIKDTTTAQLSLKSAEPVTSWRLDVKSSSGQVVRNASGSGTPPSQVSFDGRGNSGNVLPDGTYEGVYQVTLADGMSNSVSQPFVINTVPPKVALSVSTKIFMPNSTGSTNTEVISYTTNEPVTWTGSLVNNQHQALITTNAPMSLNRVVLTKSNPVVAQAPAGLYILNLTFEDAAGNTYSPPPVDISLFTHPIATTIEMAKAGFSPLAPAGSNTISASLSTDTPSGVQSYTVDVVGANNSVVATSQITGALQSTYTWDGMKGVQGSGQYPPDGTYRMQLTLHYTNGLASTGTSQPFAVDVTPPQIRVAPQNTPFIVAANGDTVNGNIQAQLTVSDAKRKVTSWTATLTDPVGNSVKTARGSSATSQLLSWAGDFPVSGPTPTAVSPISYQLKVTATDEYANSTSLTTQLPLNTIGRLENGKIHLLVPNLLFGPYKYALDSKSQAQGTANEQTLAEVAQLLKRYPAYRVEVDGYSMEIYKPTSPYYNQQEDIIVPLSKNRADIARTSLEQLGLPASRIVARYWGGENTLVDPLNVDLRWQNRRVEFILLPPGTEAPAEPASLVKRFTEATSGH